MKPNPAETIEKAIQESLGQDGQQGGLLVDWVLVLNLADVQHGHEVHVYGYIEPDGQAPHRSAGLAEMATRHYRERT